MKILRIAAAAMLLVFGALTPTSGTAAEAFDQDQKSAIETIVRDYLIANPEVIAEAMVELQKREIADKTASQKQKLSEYREMIERSPHSFVAGNPDGDVTLVEFFDYNCGYCRRALADLQDLLKTDPNLRVVFKEFPILRQESVDAAKVSIAALRQGKYMAFHTALMTSPGMADEDHALAVAESIGLDMDQVRAEIAKDDILDAVREAHQLAEAFDLQGTPAYIIGDEVVVGAVGFKELQEKIKSVRSKGCTTC